MRKNIEAIEADQFVVKDARGQQRIRLGIGEDDSASLVLMDGQRRPRIDLSVSEDGAPNLVLMDEPGRPRIGLSLAQDGASSLGLGDADGKLRIGMCLSKDGEPGLVISDTRGVQRIVISVRRDGSAGLYFANTKDEAPIQLGLDKDGFPRLALGDRRGEIRISFYVSDQGKPGLAIADADGSILLTLDEILTLSNPASRDCEDGSVAEVTNEPHLQGESSDIVGKPESTTDDELLDPGTVPFILGSHAFTVKDYHEAIKLFKKAANLGSPTACMQLGQMYRLGVGCKKDKHSALGYFQEGAQGGLGECYAEMARLYPEKDHLDDALYYWTKYFKSESFANKTHDRGCYGSEYPWVLLDVEGVEIPAVHKAALSQIREETLNSIASMVEDSRKTEPDMVTFWEQKLSETKEYWDRLGIAREEG